MPSPSHSAEECSNACIGEDFDRIGRGPSDTGPEATTAAFIPNSLAEAIQRAVQSAVVEALGAQRQGQCGPEPVTRTAPPTVPTKLDT